MLVPPDELRRRLGLVGRVLRLRDGARESADKERRKKRRVKADSEPKLSIKAIRNAYRRDPELKAIPFRSLYTLALARERVGKELEGLVRRLGQGKALEIALITDEDAQLRRELIDKGMRSPSERWAPIERVTIADLRAYIAERRSGSRSKRSGRVRLPGGKRGPRVRWPESLNRVLAPLLDEQTWLRIKQAFKLSESNDVIVPAPGASRSPGTRTLPRLGRPQLKAILTRVNELAGMLRTTIKRERTSGR